jgi:hypothetical protein
VFVVGFNPSIDSKSMFEVSWRNELSTSTYNILGDAGYIPHFAYQSLVRYADKDGGTAYTWKNKYLGNKNHMQFELLGLDDKNIPDLYENMERLVVEDITDECKTLLCPGKFMDDIYRIWCETETEKARYGDFPYDMYFKNEYKDYPNPELDFGNGDVVTWTAEDDDLFELDLPMDYDVSLTQDELDAIDNDTTLSEE